MPTCGSLTISDWCSLSLNAEVHQGEGQGPAEGHQATEHGGQGEKSQGTVSRKWESSTGRYVTQHFWYLWPVGKLSVCFLMREKQSVNGW